MVKWVASLWKTLTDVPEDPADWNCPVCGYYCTGHGGIGCIDKKGAYEAYHGMKDEGTADSA